MGMNMQCQNDGIVLSSDHGIEAVPYLETGPYPGFPTDLQSPLMAVLCRAKGESRICERMFENRFRTVGELWKMGAKITCTGNQAVICGIPRLQPATVTAPDLRGGAALVIAALQCEGRTEIYGTEYIERGYEDICRDLCTLGAAARKKQ
jgi:UDP-N-acetylglucosamine 1-carboxyvinyltransferase